MLNKKLFLLLLLLLPIASAVDINNTLFRNDITNYSIYINETVTFDEIRVTDAGRIEFYGLNTSLTIGKFYNLNDTYNSIIDFYNLTNALIYYENGTVLEQKFTGQLNISVPILTNLIIMNNYVIDDGEEPSVGDTVNQGGGPGDTKINNTLLGPLGIQIENLDKSFIFMSNGTILTFIDGSLNITLNEGEYFYIVDYEELLALNENNGTTAHDLSSNSNDGTITDATWNNDGILITLANLVDYTINTATGLFTIVNDDYLWAELQVSWDYNNGETCDIIDKDTIESAFSAFVMGLLGFLGVMGVIIGILWLFYYLKPLFSKEDGIQNLGG